MILHADVYSLWVTIAVAQKLHQPACTDELSRDNGRLKSSAEIVPTAADIRECAESECTEPYRIIDEAKIAL